MQWTSRPGVVFSLRFVGLFGDRAFAVTVTVFALVDLAHAYLCPLKRPHTPGAIRAHDGRRRRDKPSWLQMVIQMSVHVALYSSPLPTRHQIEFSDS